MLTDEELDMMQIIGHVAEVSNRYHECCYESSCPYIFQDGDNLSVCSIVLRKDFEEKCPFNRSRFSN